MLITALCVLFVANDKDSFREMFSQSLLQKKDLLTYARLRCAAEFQYYGSSVDYAVPHKEVLFEIMGYPHFMEGEDECKCFLAVAKPYPSRNTAMYVSRLSLIMLFYRSYAETKAGDRMNTFLELKIENARLQEHLYALRLRSQELSTAPLTRGSVPVPSSSLTSSLSNALSNSLSFSNGSMSAQLATNLGLDPARQLANSGYYGHGSYGGPSGFGAGMVVSGSSGYGQLEDEESERRASKKVRILF